MAAKANANVTGMIAILGVDGKYMRVTPSHGLEFGIQKLEDTAKFEVHKYDGGKVGFKGSNGKFVNMYYIDDVKCEGPGGGLSMGIVYLAEGQINLTITGYQGQDGRTRYLSSEAGNASYNGSLAVKQFEDPTCRFTIQNL